MHRSQFFDQSREHEANDSDNLLALGPYSPPGPQVKKCNWPIDMEIAQSNNSRFGTPQGKRFACPKCFWDMVLRRVNKPRPNDL
jgi:hypothetical protein